MDTVTNDRPAPTVRARSMARLLALEKLLPELTRRRMGGSHRRSAERGRERRPGLRYVRRCPGHPGTPGQHRRPRSDRRAFVRRDSGHSGGRLGATSPASSTSRLCCSTRRFHGPRRHRVSDAGRRCPSASRRLSRPLLRGAPADEADRAVARMLPQSVRSCTEVLTRVAWKTIPSTYVVCEQDNVLAPAFQEQMASRATTVRRLLTGHSPFLSSPAEVAKLITTVIAEAAPADRTRHRRTDLIRHRGPARTGSSGPYPHDPAGSAGGMSGKRRRRSRCGDATVRIVPPASDGVHRCRRPCSTSVRVAVGGRVRHEHGLRRRAATWSRTRGSRSW